MSRGPWTEAERAAVQARWAEPTYREQMSQLRRDVHAVYRSARERQAKQTFECGIVDCADCGAPVAPHARERVPIRCNYCWEAHIERVLADRRRIAA